MKLISHITKRKYNKIKNSKLFIIIILSIIISIIFIINIISKKIAPTLFEMAELEINKISTIVVNAAVSETLENYKYVNDIVITTLSDDKSIQAVDFNSTIVNKLLSIITIDLQKKLKDVEKGNSHYILEDSNKKGVVMEIPMGSAFKNVFFSNLGPKIPVRIHYLGDINSNIKTKLTPYGINNALIEVGIFIEIKAKVIFPFTSKIIAIKCDIPLIIKMVQGKVPSYYGGELLKNSGIYSIPIE